MMALALRAFSSSAEIAGVAWGAIWGDAWVAEAGVADAGVAAFCGCSHAWDHAEHTRTRMGRSSFIPFVGVIACNQNCSVFCGLSARSSRTPLVSWMQEKAGMQAGRLFL